jgi:hypothetical protein
MDAAELFVILAALEARGLVAIEENDLGELRVSPTQAGVDALRGHGEE